MSGLIVLGVVMTLLVVAGMVWPLGRQPLVVNEEREQLLRVRDRLVSNLKALTLEDAAGSMDSAIREEEESRLQAELADVLHRLDAAESQQEPASTRPSRRPQVLVALVLVLFMASAGGGLYLLMGQPVSAEKLAQQAHPPMQRATVPPMVLEMVARLEKRLKENPSDAQGWARLGRSYMVMQRMGDARDAYAKAHALEPNNVEILADYANMIYRQHPGMTQGLVYELFSKLYKLAPDHVAAQWFMGLAAFEKGDFGKALGFWERLYNKIPADNPAREQVKRAIDEARARQQGKAAG